MRERVVVAPAGLGLLSALPPASRPPRRDGWDRKRERSRESKLLPYRRLGLLFLLERRALAVPKKKKAPGGFKPAPTTSSGSRRRHPSLAGSRRIQVSGAGVSCFCQAELGGTSGYLHKACTNNRGRGALCCGCDPSIIPISLTSASRRRFGREFSHRQPATPKCPAARCNRQTAALILHLWGIRPGRADTRVCE